MLGKTAHLYQIFSDLKTDTSYVYSIEYMSELLVEDTVVFKTDSVLRFNFHSTYYDGLIPHEDLRVYPIPARAMIHVSGLTETCRYKLMDLHGRVVLSGNLDPGNFIDISGIQAGIYLLKPSNYLPLKVAISR